MNSIPAKFGEVFPDFQYRKLMLGRVVRLLILCVMAALEINLPLSSKFDFVPG